MNIYAKKSVWKLLLLIAALAIIAASLAYTQFLAKKIAESERNDVKLLAQAFEYLPTVSDNSDPEFILKVIENNKTIPLILVSDGGMIIGSKNLDSVKTANDTTYLAKELAIMKDQHEPFVINLGEGQKSFIYYKDSFLLQQLKYYPFFQWGIIAVFLLISYILFSTARKAEQNQVWVGMAKETAHQLGTPVSSLNAWIEHLKVSITDEKNSEIIHEIENDLKRLELIADRFSKIGSAPKLTEVNLHDSLQENLDYIRKRASGKAVFELKCEAVMARINPPLFDWVIENLLKNALDAMEGKGRIEVNVFNKEDSVIVDIKDSGTGIPKNKFKTVFQPGYSTKKRGWGLGLSLSKRIIESYHNGKIFVKESSSKGTTFRIVLKP